MKNKPDQIQSTEAPVWEEKTVLLKELKPYEKNPRTISDEAYAKLKASIAENGYHTRLLCQPDMSVIGGHQRIKALMNIVWF